MFVAACKLHRPIKGALNSCSAVGVDSVSKHRQRSLSTQKTTAQVNSSYVDTAEKVLAAKARQMQQFPTVLWELLTPEALGDGQSGLTSSSWL